MHLDKQEQDSTSGPGGHCVTPNMDGAEDPLPSTEEPGGRAETGTAVPHMAGHGLPGVTPPLAEQVGGGKRGDQAPVSSRPVLFSQLPPE